MAVRILFMLVACEAALVTQGPWIINSTNGRRVHLRCLNWYGAQQEMYVVGGLEVRGVGELVGSIVNIGANCVRIPFSNELTKWNPVIDPTAVRGIRSGECNATARAMDVMDCVVHHLKAQNVLIIFNSHNSRAGWVGASASEKKGLWNMPGYSTEDWVQSMELLVRRYEIAGMDLRNEIQDQNGVRITWGESENVDTDWLAASSMASNRLHMIDPSILIIVGGLCWNLDLRHMMQRIGPEQAFDRRKLVYTSHIYTWSMWWHYDQGTINVVNMTAGLTSIFLLMFSVMFYFNYSSNYKRCVNMFRVYNMVERNGGFIQWELVVALMIIFFSGWLTLAIAFDITARQNGCSTMAEDAQWVIVSSSVMVAFTGAWLLYIGCTKAYHPMMVASLCFLWLGIFFVTFFIVTAYLISDNSIIDFFKIWALENRPVPVFVGEIGVSADALHYNVWRVIMELVFHKYDLDFAYWAFNGKTWRDGRWHNETYGMVAENYKTWRSPELIRELFY